MKNLGAITDPKDIITKEFLEEGIGARVNTLEDNLQMAESDIETLQGDVQSLQTDNTATKAAVQTLQNTYVPNTRKVNGKALDADITVDGLVWTITGDYNLTTNVVSNIDKTYTEIKAAIDGGYQVELRLNTVGVGVISLSYTTTRINDNGISFESNFNFNGATTHALALVNESNTWQLSLYFALTQYNEDAYYDANGFKISQLADPENNADAANKQYVDRLAIHIIKSRTIATTAWVTNTNSQASTQEKTDFSFMATISLTDDVTTDYCVDVLFSYDDQISGNFCPCVYSVAGGVIVEAKEKPSAEVTIPVIRYWKPIVQ